MNAHVIVKALLENDDFDVKDYLLSTSREAFKTKLEEYGWSRVLINSDSEGNAVGSAEVPDLKWTAYWTNQGARVIPAPDNYNVLDGVRKIKHACKIANMRDARVTITNAEPMEVDISAQADDAPDMPNNWCIEFEIEYA